MTTMASLVERLKQYASTHGMLTDADREWFRQAHDEVAALEAMCETLAGYAEHDSDCVLGIPKAIRSRSSVQEECTCGLPQALTQYRAMKEKNNG